MKKLSGLELGRLQGMWLVMKSMNVDAIEIPYHVFEDMPIDEIEQFFEYDKRNTIIRIRSRPTRHSIQIGHYFEE